MQQTFPPSTVFPRGSKEAAHLLSEYLHSRETNLLHFQLLTLSQTPESSSPMGQQGTGPSQNSSASHFGVQVQVKRREGQDHRRECKRSLPAERGVGNGLLGCGRGTPPVPLSLPVSVFWRFGLKVEAQVRRSGLWQEVNDYPATGTGHRELRWERKILLGGD